MGDIISYNKKCNRCGVELNSLNLYSAYFEKNRWDCKTCESNRKKKYNGTRNDYHKNYRQTDPNFWIKTILYHISRSLKFKKKINNTTSDIDEYFLIFLLEKQNGKCFYSEKQLVTLGRKHPWQPSLDRIDSNKGYTRDNVVLCTVAENYAKNCFDTEQFLEYVCNRDIDKINKLKQKIEEVKNYYTKLKYIQDEFKF